jgi:hypothetical protein
MTFFLEYQAAHPDRIANISHVVESPVGPTTFDITIDNTTHYEADGQQKAITLTPEGHAFAIEKETGRQVRFHTLHFQGDVPKLNLAQYATTPALARHTLERQNARYGLAYKAWQKLKR